MKKINALDCIDKIINLEGDKDTYFLNCYRLTDCLRRLEFDYTIANCVALLSNNQKVLKLVKYVVDKNIDDIKDGDFTKFTLDIILINLIKAYCLSSGIEIKQKQIKIKHIDNPILSSKEEILLFTLFNNGNIEAKDIIILRNLNLVRYFAYRYAAKHEINDINTINDMISYGTIGLCKAIDDFKLDMGRFSTYAYSKIMSEISAFLKYNNYVIPMPKAHVDKKMLLNKHENNLAIILGRKPTKDELVEYVGMSLNNLEKFLRQDLNFVDAYYNDGEQEVSLLDDISSDDKIDLDLTNNVVVELFDKCQLTLNQRKYLMHYCFDDLNFKEIGDIYGVTRQGVQNVIKAAVVKIKKSSYGQNYLAQCNTKGFANNKRKRIN